MPISDYMTANPITMSPDSPVLTAIELLVNMNISGIPVTDEDGYVLGIVSGFDIICLQASPGGHVEPQTDMFPAIGSCDQFGGDTDKMWSSFLTVKEAADKTNSQTCGQLMHDATTIKSTATIEEAAQIIFFKKLYRLCVVDKDDKLVGMLSRGDILKVTLTNLKSYLMDSGDDL
ncbi:hypothetical protein CYMTET_10590 [Cymbomonas tetramitiformis]|uniref:CBS domain-containing protein n=1 Tax=Cymbomonas tetramitiformis TaxID=36881 RepID=A0AAE0LAL1_9CHLO|nr:hypothetical protein CYMTET_13869 [Cymbomonas tetramitiformis]KAK3281628.1 hypothetical protein CYMTET_10590 [Cymbomonas tetramitiformis]